MIEVMTPKKSFQDGTGPTQTTKGVSAPTLNDTVPPDPPEPPAAPSAAIATRAPLSGWCAHRAGFTGQIGAEERLGVDPFTVRPSINRDGSRHEFMLHFSAPREHVLPSVERGRARFDAYVKAVRDDAIASPEHVEWSKSISAIERLLKKDKAINSALERLGEEVTRVVQSDESEDSEITRINLELRDQRSLIELLSKERTRLESSLPDLEVALRKTVNDLATKRRLELLDTLSPELNNLAGILDGKPDALDRLVELVEFRSHLTSEGHHTGSMIGAAIIGVHASTAKQIAGPTIIPMFAPSGHRGGAA